MEELITARQADIQIIRKIEEFLNIKQSNNCLLILRDQIKHLCIDKLCAVIGIKCKCNYESKFFSYFSSVVGQAVCQTLNIPIIIAEDKFRLIRYEHINFVERAVKILQENEIEEAFIELFEFLDKHKKILDYV